MNIITLEWLKERRACKEGLERFKLVYGGAAELSTIIHREIEDGKQSYANWLIAQKMNKKQQQEYVNYVVKRAIGIVKKIYSEVMWNRWADKWLSGEDRTRKSAYAAAASIDTDGACAAAYTAAYTAYAAAYAYVAATSAAYAANAAATSAAAAADAYAAAAYAAYAANAADACTTEDEKIFKNEILLEGLKIMGYKE